MTLIQTSDSGSSKMPQEWRTDDDTLDGAKSVGLTWPAPSFGVLPNILNGLSRVKRIFPNRPRPVVFHLVGEENCALAASRPCNFVFVTAYSAAGSLNTIAKRWMIYDDTDRSLITVYLPRSVLRRGVIACNECRPAHLEIVLHPLPFWRCWIKRRQYAQKRGSRIYL